MLITLDANVPVTIYDTEDFSNVSTTGASRTIPTTRDFSKYDNVYVKLTTKPYSSYVACAVSNATSNTITLILVDTAIATGTYSLTGTIYGFNDK